MINHGRTLLLNIWAQSAQSQQAGYELIPADFRPLVLPSSLKLIWNTLFGRNPDQRFLNLRGRELLSYIHQTPLEDYLYKLDPRVTYWPEPTATRFDYLPSIRVTQVSGAKRSIAVGGEFVANNNIGRAKRQYTLSLNPGAVQPITLENTTEPIIEEDGNDDISTEMEFVAQTTVNTQTVYEASRSNTSIAANDIPTVTLNDTAVNVRLEPLSTDPATLFGKWYIVLETNPAPVITTLFPSLELLGEPIFLELFGVVDEEPYATFKNVWFDHPLPAYRLSGLVMALIYRMEQIRIHAHG